jgi:type II secretory pathway predicted ATPase ExeA
MYENFYGLKNRPFLTVPDPEFLYWSEGHDLAFTMLRYGLETRALITVITGEIGAGKTTLLRHLMNELPDNVTMGLVSNMQEGRGELLHWVMMALGQPFGDAPYVQQFKAFQDFLIEKYAEGQKVMLVFDEAQNLSVKALEELRMLSNINADKDELLQLVLVGQPQLRDLLARPELVQFSQRIASDFHLGALSPGEVCDYIHHRMAVAGATRQVFSDRCCELVHEVTGGVPRLINILCDLILVYGYSCEAQLIEEDLLIEFITSVRRYGIYSQFTLKGGSPRLVRTSGAVERGVAAVRRDDQGA